MKKYNDNFERDFKWYLSVRHHFNFDGVDVYIKRKDGIAYPVIVYDKQGADGKYAFYKWDSNGEIIKTKHPNLLHTLLKTKGSVNLNIKMYAETRASGILPKILFHEEICKPFKVPDWFIESVEKQKMKYYNKF